MVGVVGDSSTVAARWTHPLAFCFIDGGHGEEPAWADYRGWAPHVVLGGWLAIHDVFPDPADGGRPPYELFCAALASGEFAEDGGAEACASCAGWQPPRPSAPRPVSRPCSSCGQSPGSGLGQVERGGEAFAPEESGGR